MPCLRLPALAALLLSCAATAAPAVAQISPPADVFPLSEREAFHAQIVSNGAMRDLMEADPAGFKAFEDGLYRDIAAGKVDTNGARQRGYDFATATRARLLSTLSAAPDADYLAFVRVQLATMKTVGRYNTRACYEFVENGGLSQDTVATIGPDLAVEIEKLSRAQMTAARAGAKTPVKRQPASGKEGEAVVQSYVGLGGEVAWLKAMGDKTTASLTPEERCDGAVKWVEALLAQPPAAAARLLSAE